MTNPLTPVVKSELDHLTDQFFRAVSFGAGEFPRYEDIHALFIENGLLIKNVGTAPEISSVRQFIEPRSNSSGVEDERDGVG